MSKFCSRMKRSEQGYEFVLWTMTHARCVRLRFINKAVKRQPSYEANLIKLSCLMRQKSYQDAYNLVISNFNNTQYAFLFTVFSSGRWSHKRRWWHHPWQCRACKVLNQRLCLCLIMTCVKLQRLGQSLSRGIRGVSPGASHGPQTGAQTQEGRLQEWNQVRVVCNVNCHCRIVLNLIKWHA